MKKIKSGRIKFITIDTLYILGHGIDECMEYAFVVSKKLPLLIF